MTTLPRRLSGEFAADACATFKTCTAQMDATLQTTINYFVERNFIERAYFEALDKLSKKMTADTTTTTTHPDLTATKAWAGLSQLTQSLSSHHQQISACIDVVIQDLHKTKTTQQSKLDDVRKVVKKSSKEYDEMKLVQVPKMKNAYFKKSKECEAAEKKSANGFSTVKMNKELETAESSYRHGVQELEEMRQGFERTREIAQRTTQKLEHDRIVAVQALLTTYTDAERKLGRAGGEAVDKCAVLIDAIKPAEDARHFLAEFERNWPAATPLYYESYTHGKAKDMVFGVPLETLLRGHPTDGIPAVLFKCIQALNARGLQKEGLYRMSGKKSEMTELKRQLEHDVHAVDLMTEKWDVHSIANLVKLYLRQLPVPVFPFPPAERSAYAELGEAERVTLLRGKINALPRGHLTVLKYLVDHLSRVIQQSAYNKMTGPNLSLIFGPIMFQEQMEAISPEALQAPGGPISHFFQKSETRLPAAAERLDLTQYQLFKTDAALEDLVAFRDRLGLTAVPARTDSLEAEKP